jgi:hypothetical protein
MKMDWRSCHLGGRACEQIVEMNTTPLTPSFPPKRESRNINYFPWVPAYAGTTIWYTDCIFWTHTTPEALGIHP